VTHDQAEAMSMADRVILLRDGRIEQDASPETIYQKPATIFTARFIGTPPMNILRLAEGSNGNGVMIEGMEEPPPRDMVPECRPASCLGIRPENISIGAGDGLPVTVKSIEYLGADSIVDCDLSGQTVAVRTPGKAYLKAGERIALSWRPESVHLFDAAAGHRYS